MRIVAWNCATGFHAKAAGLCALRPDVAVIPECERPERLAAHCFGQPDLLSQSAFTLDARHCVWRGEKDRKGLAVFAFGSYTLRLLHDDFTEGPIWCIPIQVATPEAATFDLLAVWSFYNRDKRNRDGNPMVHGLRKFSHLRTSPHLVVAGDFNSSLTFSKTPFLASKPSSFPATNAALEALGLVSAYHAITKEAFGKESQPTHYWKTRERGRNSFHIDYVYIPAAWSDGLAVTCGDFDFWVKQQRSDHVPVIVDINFPSNASADT